MDLENTKRIGGKNMKINHKWLGIALSSLALVLAIIDLKLNHILNHKINHNTIVKLHAHKSFPRWPYKRHIKINNCNSFLIMLATAYDPSPKSCGKWAKYHLTSTGRKVRVGYVAVDPKVIPLHSVIYIQGLGTYEAEDTGSAIKGNRIDIFYPTYEQARHFGRRRVKVWLITTP